MLYPINIIQHLLLEKDFLIINLVFGKNQQIPISNLEKLYIKFPKNKAAFYYGIMAIIIGVGVFGCIYFTDKLIVLLVVLGLGIILNKLNSRTIYEMHFLLKNGKVIKVYLPCNLKSDAVLLIQNLRNRISSN